MNKKHFLIQFLCISVLLLAVLVQGLTHAVPLKPLGGFTDELTKDTLSFKTYYDGSYQAFLTQYAKEHTGFREFFIRNYNQVMYSCFGKITNTNVVKGRHNELFLDMYLNEATGKRLLDEYGSIETAQAEARKNVEETLRLIDTLQQHGTKFLFVFCPTKCAVYPETMPRFHKNQEFSLEEYYIELFKEHDIPHIDFLSWFQAIKDTVPYRLYTPSGTHWAQWTMPFVADSILRKLESVTGYELPRIQLIDENLSTEYTLQDAELMENMNLLFPIPTPAMPRPVFTLTDTLGKDRPNLLVIADSYFYTLRTTCFVDAFNHWDYWVYNREVQSSRECYDGYMLQWVFDAEEILEDADIVMAVFTAPMLYDYMFGFPEFVQEQFAHGPATDEEAIQNIIQHIYSTPEWYQTIEQEADEKGRTVEENLRKHAEYMFNTHKYSRKNK